MFSLSFMVIIVLGVAVLLAFALGMRK